MTKRRDQFAELLKISSVTWSDYLLSNSRHSRASDFQKKQVEFRNLSITTGQTEAKRLKSSGQSLTDFLKGNEIKILPLEVHEQELSGRLLMAEFSPPNKIYLGEEVISAGEKTLTSLNFSVITNGASIREIILAHEIFHLIEDLAPTPLFTREAHYRLYKGLPFISHLRELSEIGAMAFAQEYFNLTWSPFSLNYLFKLNQSETEAEQFYQQVMSFKQK